VHTALGIWALFERREFHWKAIEPLQLALGLSVPMLVIVHVVGVRLGQALYGHEKLYPQELYTFFIASPNRLWQMLAVLVVAWVHGCIGLYFWLRMRPFFKRAAPFLLAGAVLIPTLAMLGIYQAGRATIADYQDPDWRREELSVQK
ncbi:adenylate/guanylate cyclase domain-containing protein, partial [Pandoraea nosoerga]|nr:adenylate/guanylate cyclase domain-containing protein [Pandoraea nosoerga]